ncbi:hypothetical protein ABIA22_003929 [Sinorhizobium fredii]
MKAKITGKSLPSLIKEAGGKAVYIWDTELSGFGIYLTPKGDISWLVQKWIGGRGGKAVRQVIGRSKDGRTPSRLWDRQKRNYLALQGNYLSWSRIFMSSAFVGHIHLRERADSEKSHMICPLVPKGHR